MLIFTVTLNDTKCTARKQKDGTIFVQGQLLSRNSIDLPRINYKFNAKPYTFAYGVEVNPLGVQFCRVSVSELLWTFGIRSSNWHVSKIRHHSMGRIQIRRKHIMG